MGNAKFFIRTIIFLYFNSMFWVYGTTEKLMNNVSSWIQDNSSIEVLKPLKPGSRSIVNLIQDNNHNWFVIKQLIIPNFDIEFGIVREVLASLIGETVNASLNKVRIIPANADFPGKKYSNKPATIHTFVPGKSVKNTSLKHINIRQKWDPLYKNRGLNYTIIKSMTLHADLPVIVAFDTFVSNSGRHNTNLFYDEETHKFYGIDLESSFRKPFDKDFCEIAYENFIHMKKIGIKFSKQEINALQIFTKTLRLLIEKNPPKKLHNLLDEIVQLAGFDVNLYQQLYNKSVNINKYVKHYKKRIDKQYEHAKELAVLLDTFLPYDA